MPHLAVPGAELAYESAGHASAPAVVLLHSGIATMRMWDPHVPALTAAHLMVRLDARGFGATRHDGAPFSDRDDVRSVLDHLGIERATIIGAGRGGTTALDLALEFPDRVAGVVTVGSGPSGFPGLPLSDEEHRRIDELDDAFVASDWRRLTRLETTLWAAGSNRVESDLDPRFVARAHEIAAGNVAHAAEAVSPEPLEPPAYGRLGDIRIPALVMVGEYDLGPTRAHYEHLLEALPDATGFSFPDAAHLPNLERPAEFELVLLDWLGERGL